MLISKRRHRQIVAVQQSIIDRLEADLQRMTQRNTKNVTENVRLFVKVCSAEDIVAELRQQADELRADYATLRLAYDCCEKAARLAVAEMKRRRLDAVPVERRSRCFHRGPRSLNQTRIAYDLPEASRPAQSHPRAPNSNARTPLAAAELDRSLNRPAPPIMTRSEEELTRSALARHAEAINGLALELKMIFPVACELLAELKRRT